MRLDKFFLVVTSTLFSILFSSCATMVASSYVPRYEIIDSIKEKKLAFEKVGVNEVRPTDKKAKTNRISLRGSSLVSPYGTFSKYIEEAVKSDLAELRALDQSSSQRFDIEVLENDINVSGLNKGKGLVEIKLRLINENKVTFEKVYMAETVFDSYFLGSQALPAGQNEYGRLIQALTTKIFSDEELLTSIIRRKK